MSLRTVLSFGAGATLFGPLGKFVAEPAADAWAKVTDALPFLAPAGEQLERQMQRLNAKLDEALAKRAADAAVAPAAVAVVDGGRARRGRGATLVVVVALGGGVWAYGRFTGKWWAVVPSELPATQALLDRSRARVERGVSALSEKLELARAKVAELSERVARGLSEQRAMRAQLRGAQADVGAAHQRVADASTLVGRMDARLRDAERARAYLVQHVQLLCAFVHGALKGADAIAPQDPRRAELLAFAQGERAGAPKPLSPAAGGDGAAPADARAAPELTAGAEPAAGAAPATV